MTNPNLGRQWFHGSPHEFKPGDVLKPPSQTGRAMNRGDSNPDHVYITDHPYFASHYTYSFDENGKLAPGQDEAPSGHVYQVEPLGRHLADPNAPRMLHKSSRYVTKGARVVRKLDPGEWR